MSISPRTHPGLSAGLGARLKRAAEVVGALLLAVMFGAFLLQVFMRYVVNRPLEWTLDSA